MRSEKLDEFLEQKANEAEVEFKEKIFSSLEEWKKNSNETVERLEALHIAGQNDLSDEIERFKRNFLFLQEQLKTELSASFRTYLNALEEVSALLTSRSAELKTSIEEKLNGQQQSLDTIVHNLQERSSQGKIFAQATREKLEAAENQINTLVASLSREFQSSYKVLSENLKGVEALSQSHQNQASQYYEANSNLLKSAIRQVQLGLEKQDVQIKIGENLIKENAVATGHLKLIINTLQENSRDFTQQIQSAIQQQEAVRAVYEKETAKIKQQIEKTHQQMLIGFGVLGIFLISIILVIVL